MQSKKLSYEDAYELVEEEREDIDPNEGTPATLTPGFIEQLKKFKRSATPPSRIPKTRQKEEV